MACLLLFFRLFTWHWQFDGILALPTINHWLRFIQPAQLHQTGTDSSIPIQTVRECDLLRDADNMQLEQIRKLHGQGMSNRKIAEELNLSPATIGKRLKEMDIEDGE